VIAVAEPVTAEAREFSPAPRSSPGGVRIVTRYRQTFETELMYPRATENPMTRDHVVTKWRANAALALSPTQASDLEGALLNVEHEPELSPLAIVADAARERAGDVARQRELPRAFARDRM
jgi:hypothetical protein